MPMTINSSPVSYVTPVEFFKRVDVRTVADWASDDGTRIGVTPPSTQPDPIIVGANVNVKSALLTASGMFEASLLKGERYQPVDVLLMVGLQPDGTEFIPPKPDSAARNFVYEIVSRLAEGLLWRRRPDLSPYPAMFDYAMQQLEELALGGKILGFVEIQAAGLPGHHVDVMADVEDRGLVVTQARRWFGTRGNELNG